jgi:hypothetical protein
MAMRTIVLALSTALLAAAVAAQETATQQPTAPQQNPALRQPEPDYSRPTLMRLFVVEPQLSQLDDVIEPEIGAVRYRSRFGSFLLGYLPFFAPLPGSVRTTTRQMVDPFVMTHMEIPSGPAAIRRQRARELRRIERLTRSAPPATESTSTTVKANP